MKKNILRIAATVTLLLALFNIIAFAIPFVRTATFWLAYAFTSVAILAQLPLSLYAFTSKGGVRDSLYGVPIARLSLIYLLAQAIIGLLCMALSKWLPFWAALVVESAMLVLVSIGCIATSTVRDELRRQDHNLQNKVAVMRELQSRAGVLASRSQDEAVHLHLRQLADDFRFSDPVSSAATAPLEADLLAHIDSIEHALTNGDRDCILKICHQTATLLAERNRLCKLNKQPILSFKRQHIL